MSRSNSARSASSHVPAATNKKLRQVAALPWRLDENGKLRILLITSRTNGKWMLPKGWPMEGKSEAEAALIEAREEAGVDGQLSPHPAGSYHYVKVFSETRSAPAQAVVYPLHVSTEQADWDEKGERRRKWVRPHKAASMVFERDLSRLLSDVAKRQIILS
jgi:8-oxo-dGTP pyrophosphatase MutT (NUDIX family)